MLFYFLCHFTQEDLKNITQHFGQKVPRKRDVVNRHDCLTRILKSDSKNAVSVLRMYLYEISNVKAFDLTIHDISIQLLPLLRKSFFIDHNERQ